METITIKGRGFHVLTPAMQKALLIAVENTFVYAGRGSYAHGIPHGSIATISSSTLRALATRKLVTLGINPDGGMEARPTPEGAGWYYEYRQRKVHGA